MSQVPVLGAGVFAGLGPHSFTVDSFDDRMLLVWVASSSATPPTSVTYGASSMTHVIAETSGDTSLYLHLYRLNSPAVGAANITITPAGGQFINYVVAAAVSNAGSLRTPFVGTFTASSTTRTVGPVPSSVDDRVLSVMFGEDPSPGAVTMTPPSGTVLIGAESGGSFGIAAARHSVESTPVNLAWTVNTGLNSTITVGIAPAASVTLPTHTPAIDFLTATDSSIRVVVDYAGIDAIDTQYSVDGGAWQDSPGGNPLDFSISGLSPTTQYSVRVRAVTEDGPSDASAPQTIETTAPEVGEVEIVDYKIAHSGGTSASVSLVADGEDISVIAIVCARDEGYGHFACTYGGVNVPVLTGDDNAFLHHQLCELVGPSPSASPRTLYAEVDQDAPGGIVLIGIAVRGRAGRRTPSRSAAFSSLGTHSGIPAEVGDLVIAACFRAGGTITGGDPITLLGAAAGDSSLRGAVGTMIADATSESVTWSGSAGSADRVYIALALEPAEGGGGGVAAPDGTVSADLAVGHNSVAVRSIVDTSTNQATDGYRYQYRIGSGSAVDLPANGLISGQTPGASVTIQVRAANDGGVSAWSSAITRRLHQSWHRPGIKRWNPSAAVGHVAVGKEPSAVGSKSGPLTTGGRDRAVILSNDVVYSKPSGAVVTPHTVTYDSVAASVAHRWVSPNNRMGTGFFGGHEVHVLAGPTVGTNTMVISPDNSGSITEHSQWFGAVAMHNVDQAAPVACVVARYEGDPKDPIETGSSTKEGVIGSIPVSYDEVAIGHLGFYPAHANVSGSGSSVGYEYLRGEVSGWSSDADAVRDGYPVAQGHTPICSTGTFGQCHVQLDLMAPGTAPLGQIIWDNCLDGNSDTIGYITRAAIVLRPSPNMLHTLDAGGSNWTCVSDCNHGRALVVITRGSDTAPTAQQISDIAHSAGSDYSGTVLYSDIVEITADGPQSGPISGVSGESVEPRLSVVYENWQSDFGDALTAEVPLAIEVDVVLNSSFSQQAALSTSITLGGSYGATFSQTSNVNTAITAASSLPYTVSTIAELTTSIVFENVVSVNYTLDAELLTQLLLDSVFSSSFDQISELTTSIEFASALGVNYTQIAELDLAPPIELEATIQIEVTSLADLNTNITISTSVDVEATQEATLNTLITLASNVIFSAELEAVIGEAQPVSEIFAELEFGVMFSVNPEYIENLDISSISNDRSVASVNTLASSGKLYLVVTRADDPAPTAEQINYIIRWH